jgi:ubiquinone/menaquinone biosynthesis C-methylase UbiE
MIPTAQATAYWTPTPADAPNVAAVARHYWDSINSPQRFWVCEAVALLGGAESLLEIGCQSGPNLRALARVWPHMQLHGLDVNRAALEEGRRFAIEAGLTRVTFHEGVVPDSLLSWAAQSVDVALSVYCLAYIGPDQIVTAVRHLLRVARKGIVLVEPMATAQEPAEEFAGDVQGSAYVEWRHDYLSILSELAEELPPGEELRAAVLPRQHVARLNGVVIATRQPAERAL